MEIEKLYLENFRNFDLLEVGFKRTNIIVGPNASGKSNLLEAIYLLSTGRSFKTRLNKELISFGKDFARIVGRVKSSNLKEGGIEIFLSLDPQTQEVKKRTVRKIKLVSVFFAPSSLDLILGPPKIRRGSMNVLFALVSKKYVAILLEFIEVLKQRNKLIGLLRESRAKISELKFWDQEFEGRAAFLRKARKQLLEQINAFLPKHYQILYHPSIFKKEPEKEIRAGFTLWGPQKDDFVFIKDDLPLDAFGSRGEVREAVFFYKLAEWKYLKEKTNEVPILLLDDIFSELDQKKRANLLRFINLSQTILTTTSLSSISPEIIKEAKIIELK